MLDIHYIINEVCKQFNITYEQVIIKSNKPKYVIPRNFCCFFLKKYTLLNDREVGKLIKRDRTSVISILKRIFNDVDTNYKIKMKFDYLDEHFSEVQKKDEVSKNEVTFIITYKFHENEFEDEIICEYREDFTDQFQSILHHLPEMFFENHHKHIQPVNIINISDFSIINIQNKK
ncbi:helix-turn-helix domain-containing protein [Abyssalbus ytuae]|uniref:Chromosomal replication initiator DnaA C-terminal domain-containing protein n=1 Tax=Abyssalbus ytuae TaxID=2926907 RepID=A0A9E6ZQF2_9FLAO|nr:helix-turn-helix domain-containing protein [Abyssalbus ytuae]UOB18605.1 hypothetical protein MQE35_04775 [Abyssalbus ytuae]